MTSVPKLAESSFWDSYADGLSGLSPFLVGLAERALSEADLSRGARILDIATATGTVAVVAARAGMNVVAVDFSAAMIERVASYAISTIEARQMDGCALAFEDASFDAAFSMFGVSLFEDWRTGLSEMARVVRPGGVGSVGTWTKVGGAAGSLFLTQLCAELFPDLAPPASADGQREMGDPQRFVAAMESAGFGGVRIVAETRDYPISRDELGDPDRLFTFNSQWKALDRAKRQIILSAIADRYPGEHPILVPSAAAIATGVRS